MVRSPDSTASLLTIRFNGPTRFPQHLFTAHDHGRLRSKQGATYACTWSLPKPDCTSAVSTQEYDRPVSDPGARLPGLHLRLSRRSLRPWMCHHTWEPTVLSRVSCRPVSLNLDRFNQPCLLPWRNPLLPPITAGCWAGISEDCRRRTTWRPLTVNCYSA